MTADIERVAFVARRLEDLREHVVFLGGSVISALITDPAAPPIRATEDVDLIIDAKTRRDYYTFSARVRDIGFSEDMSEGAPICRWIIDGVPVDIMPVDGAVLGFSNRWYGAAFRDAMPHLIDGMEVRLVSAPCFMATKLEAFDDRGDGDYRASRDLEDVIALVDGRKEIVADVSDSSDDVREYVAERVGRLLGDARFIESLPGHLPGDETSQKRVPVVVSRLKGIAAVAAHR